MRCRLQFAFLALLPLPAVLSADQVEVTHNVNLRRDPSTDNPAISLIHPPETLDLLEPGRPGAPLPSGSVAAAPSSHRKLRPPSRPRPAGSARSSSSAPNDHE